MDIESIQQYAIEKPDTDEGFPFGESVLVFKVSGKMFLLVSLDEQPLRFSVKCEPDRAIELREEYPEHVLPAYHMNKQHWNTIVVDGRLSSSQLKGFIDDSYKLVSVGKKKGKSSKK